jgi:antitoxin (DNA-binding transcriptional repressor) of toxin-antitoxin stability system
MSDQVINIHEAKTRLSSVLMDIEKTGNSFIICRNGKPVAKLSPYTDHRGERLGKHPTMSNIQIKYDPTEDLSEEEWGPIE